MKQTGEAIFDQILQEEGVLETQLITSEEEEVLVKELGEGSYETKQ